MQIPKILHQTWKTKDVPKPFSVFVDSWLRNHPDWEYRLWTDADNRRLIAEHYGWFLTQYDRYPWPIQRVDAVRYFILLQQGGLYVDLDFMSLRPIDPLLAQATCVLGLEPERHCQAHRRETIVSNALMAAIPGHAFFEAVVGRLAEFAIGGAAAEQPILETTGPFMLTAVYNEFVASDTVCLAPAKNVYPLSLEEADDLRKHGTTPVDLSEAYAVHFHYGTWWAPETHRRRGTVVEPIGRPRIGADSRR